MSAPHKQQAAHRATFWVTLAGFNAAESADMENKLRQAGNASRYAVRTVESISGTAFPPQIVHAIVFTPAGLARVIPADEQVIRSATALGTCRLYLASPSGGLEAGPGSRLDDFIQRTSRHDLPAVAEEIVGFFHEADALNRCSTQRALRDMACLKALPLLKLLWPVCYVFGFLHVLNAIAININHKPWLTLLAEPRLIYASTFFGAFFIVHCGFTVLRNFLFGLMIAGCLDGRFAFGAACFGLTAAGTARSVLGMDQNVGRIAISVMLAIGAYAFYMHARRVRSECTSLSQLQARIADPQQRTALLDIIGRQRFSSACFPIRAFKSRSIFISYMHGSKWSSDTATLVHGWASEHGLEVFHDRSAIPSGALWRRSLLQSISECGIFVAVLDGNAMATEWVLAESAYAALLRKSIGKPRILLVIRNVQALARDQQSPFQLIYRDVFQMPDHLRHGAAILPADDDTLTKANFLKAMEGVRPMCLLS